MQHGYGQFDMFCCIQPGHPKMDWCNEYQRKLR